MPRQRFISPDASYMAERQSLSARRLPVEAHDDYTADARAADGRRQQPGSRKDDFHFLSI